MNLEDIIKTYVPLTQHSSKKGWYPVVCKVCNDHGKKGPRAAFKFEDGNVGYNCFNDPRCNASFNKDQTDPLSKAMERLLASYGIPESEYEWLNFELLKRRDAGVVTEIKTADNKTVKINPEPIELPHFFKKLSEVPEDDMWRIIAEDYLEQRGMDPAAYPYYLSYKDDTFPHWKKWYGRLIIPFFDNNNQIIFYQGRDMTGKQARKYLNVDVERENIMYGYDEIYKHTDDPLYVVEGFFDANPIGGVAIVGNKLTEGMLFHLRRSRRPKVIIPDKIGDGYELALQALKEGWSISTPDIGNCKDLNNAICRFGKLYTVMSIAEHTCDGFSAEVNLRMYCPDMK